MLIQLMILMLIQLVNNIYDDAILGFINEANGDYHLSAGPSLIDVV